MSQGFELSPDVVLPVEAVTETFAIVGKRGSGKSTTAVVMAEEMIGAGHPVLVVDPVGSWWGLRSSADGRGDGLPVVIFGGEHADVALHEKAGEVVAEAIIEGRFPAILDLSELSKSAMRRLMTDVLERLYHRNREPLHLIVDEADLLGPQRLQAEGLRLFGALDDILRRGRVRGLGATLVTQRPAVIHKDLISQTEVLVAMRLTGVRDVAAIDEWVRLNADEEEARILKASLASLPVGTAWVWSPSLLGGLQRVAVRPRRTFDSSATPRPGEQRPVASGFAHVDVAALGEQIHALTEEVAANDPVALRARIAQLERQLARQEPQVVERIVEKHIEVPIVLNGDLEQLRVVSERLANAIETARPPSGHAAEKDADRQALEPQAAPSPMPVPAAPAAGPGAPAKGQPQVPPAGERLPKAQRLVLTALAQHGSLSAVQVALLTGYSHKSGGFRNALSALRSSELVAGSGAAMTITESGRAALGTWDPLPTGAAMLRWWQDNHLGKAERAIVDVLAARHPDDVAVAEIAQATGYSASSGGFRNALSRLRTLQLAHNTAPGQLALSEELVD